jgi:hypothetical protein
VTRAYAHCLQAFDDLKMAYPKSTPERQRQLQAIGRKLEKTH